MLWLDLQTIKEQNNDYTRIDHMIDFFMEIPRNKHRILIDEDIEQILSKEESEGRILILLNGLALILSIISFVLLIFGIRLQNQLNSIIDHRFNQFQKSEWVVEFQIHCMVPYGMT